MGRGEEWAQCIVPLRENKDRKQSRTKERTGLKIGHYNGKTKETYFFQAAMRNRW